MSFALACAYQANHLEEDLNGTILTSIFQVLEESHVIVQLHFTYQAPILHYQQNLQGLLEGYCSKVHLGITSNPTEILICTSL